jgi:site-specific DNA-adenine methylase
MMRLFRYSGSKARLLRYFRPAPPGTRRVVEPYLGSGAYVLNSGLPGLGFEINRELVAMWHWLQRSSERELVELDAAVEAWKKCRGKPDVRDMGLGVGAQTYVRVNVCSVMVGQLSSWLVYPQHKLPVRETVRCLPRLRDIEVVFDSGENYSHSDGDLLFVDPPYAATGGNYVDKRGIDIEGSYSPAATAALLSATDNPAIFTYGSNAAETFPRFRWEKLATLRVPNMRRGGTTERTEWVSYVRFPGQKVPSEHYG